MNEEITELERQVRVLKKRLKTTENYAEQLKAERSKALDKYYDLEAKINQLDGCEHCYETQSQYDKMRSAFDRKKAEHKAIIRYLESHHLQFEGKPLSISRMIREGKNL